MDGEIELDAYALEALAEYADASETERAAKARREKARDALLAMFRLHNAEVGTHDGKPVCRLIRSDREIVDTERLRDEQPYIFSRYRKLSTAYYVREIGRNS